MNAKRNNYFLRVIPTMRLYLAYSEMQILTFFLAKLSGKEEEERTTLMKSRDRRSLISSELSSPPLPLGILSDIFSDICSAILSDICSDILSGYSIWHSF